MLDSILEAILLILNKRSSEDKGTRTGIISCIAFITGVVWMSIELKNLVEVESPFKFLAVALPSSLLLALGFVFLFCITNVIEELSKRGFIILLLSFELILLASEIALSRRFEFFW